MRRLSALPLILALFVAGCISDSITIPRTGAPTSGGDQGPPGSYALRSVNGAGLPYTSATSGADTYVILDDAFTLTATGTAAGTWTEIGHLRTTIAGVTNVRTLTDKGTYASTETRVTFTSTTPGVSVPVFEAGYSAGTLTLAGKSLQDGSPVTAIYSK